MAVIKWYEKFAPKPTTTANGVDVLGLPFANFYYSGKIMVHIVQYDERHRLDLIAWKYLNNFSMWRLIADFNSIFDPIGDIVPQKTLFIPTSQVDLSTAYVPNTYVGAQ